MSVKPLLYALLILNACFVIISCKKDEPTVQATPPAPAPTANVPITDDMLKDSTLIYSRDIYLWNTQVPASFAPRTFSDPGKIMEAIRQYSIEPGFGQPVDRFSFALKKTEWDEMSAGLNTVATTTSGDGDLGLNVFFRVDGDLRVRMVEPASPAGLAGIRRGWRITAINGNTDITSANADYIVDKVYESATASIDFLKPDGKTVKISLTRANYKQKQVYLDTVYSINNKKIGYLVFNSFLGKEQEIYNEFQRVFNNFESEGISELVVDLRYNGGGYVSVQEKLANYLVKSSANGNIMMKQVYNAANSVNNETKRFKKEGTLNFSRIYFIVGGSTASASELLINNLKPYMEVKMIGATTYGKPVGYFPIPVGEWFIFPVSFRSTNKNGEGNYFNGMPVNSQVADGLNKDWGDITEARLASAVRNITTGSYRLQAEAAYVEPENVAAGNRKLDEPFLKITIGDAKPLK